MPEWNEKQQMNSKRNVFKKQRKKDSLKKDALLKNRILDKSQELQNKRKERIWKFVDYNLI